MAAARFSIAPDGVRQKGIAARKGRIKVVVPERPWCARSARVSGRCQKPNSGRSHRPSCRKRMASRLSDSRLGAWDDRRVKVWFTNSLSIGVNSLSACDHGCTGATAEVKRKGRLSAGLFVFGYWLTLAMLCPNNFLARDIAIAGVGSTIDPGGPVRIAGWS